MTEYFNGCNPCSPYCCGKNNGASPVETQNLASPEQPIPTYI